MSNLETTDLQTRIQILESQARERHRQIEMLCELLNSHSKKLRHLADDFDSYTETLQTIFFINPNKEESL